MNAAAIWQQFNNCSLLQMNNNREKIHENNNDTS